MRLRHIEVFHAVMVTGSVSGAARLINVTQPAVSRTLQHAEVNLGISLFTRSRNRLIPTPEALALYPHVQQLFGDLDSVQRIASTLRTGEGTAELRVVTILTLGNEVMPRALTLFRKKHPQVHVAFQALHSPQILAALALQEADLGFLFSATPHPALIQEKLAEAELVCIVGKQHVQPSILKQPTVTFEDLAAISVIGLDMNDPLGLMLGQACREAGANFEPICSVQTYHAALALAKHGHGAAIVDSCTALSAISNDVIVRPIRPVVPVPVHLVRPAARPMSVIAKSFAKAVSDVLRNHAFGDSESPSS
jgi:DNA-binding transcriptional LysR family regulator